MTDLEMIQYLRGCMASDTCREIADRLEALTQPKDDDRETRGVQLPEIGLLKPGDTLRAYEIDWILVRAEGGNDAFYDPKRNFVRMPKSDPWECWVPTGATLDRLRPKKETLREALRAAWNKSGLGWTREEIRKLLDRFPEDA